jgi:hypothetical protein
MLGGPKSPPIASRAIFMGAEFCGDQAANAKPKKVEWLSS